MELQDIIKWFEEERNNSKLIHIPEDIFSKITPEIANELASRFSHDTLVYLPEKEIKFFEWLKTADYKIWEDLWGNVEEDPYVVSISFLPILVDKFGGFPICDLAYNDNYYFTEEMIIKKTSHLLLETLKEKFLRKEKLTIAQAFLLEVSITPQDIWHFAYNHNVSLNEVKLAVQELIEDNLIVHLKTAEELANFVQF